MLLGPLLLDIVLTHIGMKILIADKYNIVRKGIVAIVSDNFSEAHISEAADVTELLPKLIKEDWDAIITGIDLPGRPGLEILRDIKMHASFVPVLVLSPEPAEEYAVRAIQAGASGFLTLNCSVNDILRAIECLLSGKKYCTEEVSEILVGLLREGSSIGHENLSNREFEVLKLIALGKTVSEMANLLSLSANTVNEYKSRMCRKMHLETAAAIVKYAVHHQLI